MARPTKSVKTMSKNLTKEEIAVRTEAENKLRGNADKLKPPTYLTARQKRLFKFIVTELEPSEVLGNLDIFILEQCATTIDRIRSIEEEINNDRDLLFDRSYRTTLSVLRKDFFRFCNELSLSPQSRAKLSVINLQQQQNNEDELLKVLRGGKS